MTLAVMLQCEGNGNIIIVIIVVVGQISKSGRAKQKPHMD